MIFPAKNSVLMKLVCVSEQGGSGRMSGNIQQQRAAVEQLRREANIKRISVSQAVEDIKVSLKHIQIVCKRFILLHSC